MEICAKFFLLLSLCLDVYMEMSILVIEQMYF